MNTDLTVLIVEDDPHVLLGCQQALALEDIHSQGVASAEEALALVGEHFAEGTLERYKTTYKHTADFIKMKYKVDDLPITRVNHEFIYEFD